MKVTEEQYKRALVLIQELREKGLTNEARRLYDLLIDNGHYAYIKN